MKLPFLTFFRISPIAVLAVSLGLPFWGCPRPVFADDHDHDHGSQSAAEHGDDCECEDDRGHDHASGGDFDGAIDWSTGSGFGIGGFLFPELFAVGVFGDSTGEPEELAASEHDPQTSATLQSFDIGTVLGAGPLTGFANYEATTNATGDWTGVLEEGYLKWQALDGLALKGGQFLNSFGFQNQRHIHAWDFVDQYLVNGRMLNEGELTVIGGETTISLPTPWKSTLTVGGGGIAAHGHGDGEHHHGDEAAEFDPEGANFDAWVLTGNYRSHYGPDDRMAATASFAIGENGFGETTQVYGLGHQRVWGHRTPHNGAGSLLWRTEAMLRDVEAISGGHEDEEEAGHDHHGSEEHEHGHAERRRASLDEFGAYSMLQYGLCDWANAAFRAEWVSGIDEMGLDERWRLSPALTAWMNRDRTAHARLQYNYDHGDRIGDEHSIWLQIGISWGGAPGDHGHEH